MGNQNYPYGVGIGDFLNSLGQSSMTSMNPFAGLDQQQLMAQQHDLSTALGQQQLQYQTIYPGELWEPPKGEQISCPECDKNILWNYDRDCYGPCSCGHKEGAQTSKGWLESRIAEVVG